MKAFGLIFLFVVGAGLLVLVAHPKTVTETKTALLRQTIVATTTVMATTTAITTTTVAATTTDAMIGKTYYKYFHPDDTMIAEWFPIGERHVLCISDAQAHAGSLSCNWQAFNALVTK